jgi:hypothetical protein
MVEKDRGGDERGPVWDYPTVELAHENLVDGTNRAGGLLAAAEAGAEPAYQGGKVECEDEGATAKAKE